ncbi:hypothetical protein VaNZ11_003902, partial [Volvox africanus]
YRQYLDEMLLLLQVCQVLGCLGEVNTQLPPQCWQSDGEDSTIADTTSYTAGTVADKASKTVIKSVQIIVAGTVVYKLIDVIFKGGRPGPPPSGGTTPGAGAA